MRYSEFRHETRKAHSSLFVISFLSVFICAAALGTIRLYGLYLEHRISETTANVESCREQNLSLSRQYQELLAPAKQMQTQYLPQLQETARSLDTGKVLAMVRGA